VTLRRRPLVVGEVKWGEYGKKDVEDFKTKTRQIKAEKIFVAKEERGIEDEEVKMIYATDLADFVPSISTK
ncbi:MAG: hypothetical protein QXG38_02255, partial [Candidatus Hadarchaeales archaeon]